MRSGTSGFDAVEAFEKSDRTYGSLPVVRGFLDILLYYWHTYSRARAQYPKNVVKQLLNDGLRAMGTYQGCRANLERAQRFFAARRDQAPDPHLIDQYLFECRRLIAVVDAYHAITSSIRLAREALKVGHPDASHSLLESAGGYLAKGLQSLDEMMAFAEEVKKPYLLPQILRDLSALRAYLAELTAVTGAAAVSKEALARLEAMLAEVG